MLNENLKAIRKTKGLSQEELAIKLNVVRQTVSKWEQGRSVPDAELLLSLSEVLQTPVSTLLGETVAAPEPDAIKALSEKLEVLNLQLARRKELRRKLLHILCIALCAGVVLAFGVLFTVGSPYLDWNYQDPETAVMGTALHAMEWLFVRAAPVLLRASRTKRCGSKDDRTCGSTSAAACWASPARTTLRTRSLRSRGSCSPKDGAGCAAETKEASRS